MLAKNCYLSVAVCAVIPHYKYVREGSDHIQKPFRILNLYPGMELFRATNKIKYGPKY